MPNDGYLTEYYFDGTGDQFYPGCPASIAKDPQGFQSGADKDVPFVLPPSGMGLWEDEVEKK